MLRQANRAEEFDSSSVNLALWGPYTSKKYISIRLHSQQLFTSSSLSVLSSLPSISTNNYPVRQAAKVLLNGWCWFIVREKQCWTAGWFWQKFKRTAWIFYTARFKSSSLFTLTRTVRTSNVDGSIEWAHGIWKDIGAALRVCSFSMQTQNILSSTHHIESLDACMEH
jgi:hypothetical protein